jgi:UrcA family protein
MTNFVTHTAFVAAAAFTAIVGAPVVAQDNVLPSVEINTADLNLASAAGLKQLDQRIRRASRQVCGASYGIQALSTTQAINQCMVIATNNAKAAAAPKIATANVKSPITTASR